MLRYDDNLGHDDACEVLYLMLVVVKLTAACIVAIERTTTKWFFKLIFSKSFEDDCLSSLCSSEL